MMSWGTRGIIRNCTWTIEYPEHMEIEAQEYTFSNEQMAPRGRLPICPDTCFVSGGIYPSNIYPDTAGIHSPPLVEPEGEGVDYYDVLKGDTSAPVIDPDQVSGEEEHNGCPFHGTITDMKSGDVKWFKTEDDNDWIVFLGADRKVYAQTIVDPTTEGNSWSIDIPSVLLDEIPDCIHSSYKCQRSIRIDPKKSVVVLNKFVYFMSVCIWEIKPGCVESVQLDDYYYYPADEETGVIEDYDAVNRTMPEKENVIQAILVDVDDSICIRSYNHYRVVVDLNNNNYTTVPASAYATTQEGIDSRASLGIIGTETLSGEMPITIQVPEKQQGVYFKARESVFDYAMDAETHSLIVPDGAYSLVTHEPDLRGNTTTPHPNCASTMGLDISSAGLSLPVEPYFVDAHPSPPPPYEYDTFLCTVGYYSYLNPHYHTPNPGTVDHPEWEYGSSARGVAAGTVYTWDTEPSNDNFAWAVPADIIEVESDVQWVTDASGPVDIPTDEEMADLVHDADDEAVRWEIPFGDNIFCVDLGEGSWEWTQCYLSVGPARYQGLPYEYGYWYPPSGWLPYESYYEPETDVLYKYKPIPYEWVRYTRGIERVLTATIDNCACTDTFFGDMSVYQTGTYTWRIMFLLWSTELGYDTFPVEEISENPDAQDGEIKREGWNDTSGYSKAVAMNKNNNPCQHRFSRANSTMYYGYIDVVVDGNGKVEFSNLGTLYWYDEGTGIPMIDRTNACPNASCCDLTCHKEIRPIPWWENADNNKTPVQTDPPEEIGERSKLCVLPYENESGTLYVPYGITSADTHTLGTQAFSQYSETAIKAGGSASVGKCQQVLIPFKPYGSYIDPISEEEVDYVDGDVIFFSTLGSLEKNTTYANWHDGIGGVKTEEIGEVEYTDIPSQDWQENIIYKGCLANKCVTSYRILSYIPMPNGKKGDLTTSYADGGGPIAEVAGGKITRWAARVDLNSDVYHPERNWCVFGQQDIDWPGGSAPVVSADFNIGVIDFFEYGKDNDEDGEGEPYYNQPFKYLRSAVSGVLSDAFAILKIDIDKDVEGINNDAWVFYCYWSMTAEEYRLGKVSIENGELGGAYSLDITSLYGYDQFIVDSKYLYALSIANTRLDVIDITDLSIKKTFTVNWSTMTSAKSGGVVGRYDVQSGDDGTRVKTVVEYWEYAAL